MTLSEHVNNLKGFIESMKLTDNISKRQLDTLYEKLEVLIKHLADFNDSDDDIEDSVSIKTRPSNTAAVDDDMPF